jgi:hypothetical protein
VVASFLQVLVELCRVVLPGLGLSKSKVWKQRFEANSLKIPGLGVLAFLLFLLRLSLEHQPGSACLPSVQVETVSVETALLETAPGCCGTPEYCGQLKTEVCGTVFECDAASSTGGGARLAASTCGRASHAWYSLHCC